jgi:predicted transglutaminase-like cysteine proteinase
MLRKTGILSRIAAIGAAGLLILTQMTPATALPGAFVFPLVQSEPFGLATDVIVGGPLRTKWLDASAAIMADLSTAMDCNTHRESCTSAAALRLLAMADEAHARSGLARFGETNRAVNLAIRPMSDQAQYGVEDRWSAPLATLTSGAGDCEDYAIAKYAALQLAGVDGKDLRLIILRNIQTEEDHAVVAARLNDGWYLLDNRHMAMVRDTQLTGYRPLFVLDANGVKRFREQAPVIAANERDVPPLLSNEELRMASMYFATMASVDGSEPSPLFGTAFIQLN